MSEFITKLTTFDLGGFGVFIVSMTLILIGYRFLKLDSRDGPFAKYSLQIVGLTLLVPIILLTAVVVGLDAQAVTGLLGTIVGYIFGTSQAAAAEQKQAATTQQRMEGQG